MASATINPTNGECLKALEALREFAVAEQQQRGVVDVRDTAACVRVDDADAGALGARIDAQDAEAGGWGLEVGGGSVTCGCEK